MPKFTKAVETWLQRDRTAFEVYQTRAADAIHTYGGRYLARLGEVQVLEGSWNPSMIVIELGF